MNIFDIFHKQGIKSVDDLTPEEKKTYQQWASILNRPDPTIDDLKAILPKELARANEELRKHENSKDKDSFYKAYTTLCEFILKTITSPTQEREALKAFLKQKY